MSSPIIEHLRSAGRLDRMYVGGEWVLLETQAHSAVVEPATEEPVAEIAMGSARDVAAAVAAAQRAFVTWSVSSSHSRAWPLYQITAKVGPALAAGCTVVLKPSELSPLSALLFAEVMHDAGVPAGVFNQINGQGRRLAPLWLRTRTST